MPEKSLMCTSAAIVRIVRDRMPGADVKNK